MVRISAVLKKMRTFAPLFGVVRALMGTQKMSRMVGF